MCSLSYVSIDSIVDCILKLGKGALMAKIDIKQAYRNILALFPGSPLAPTKNKNGGGEPGTDSHVISRHVDVTAIITKVVTQLCSHVIG